MIGNPNDLKGYRALRNFKSQNTSIEVDKGDLINVKEYESLSFDEQEVFVPEYKSK